MKFQPSQCSILIAENRLDTCESCGFYLRKLGFQVHTCDVKLKAIYTALEIHRPNALMIRGTTSALDILKLADEMRDRNILLIPMMPQKNLYIESLLKKRGAICMQLMDVMPAYFPKQIIQVMEYDQKRRLQAIGALPDDESSR